MSIAAAELVKSPEVWLPNLNASDMPNALSQSVQFKLVVTGT